jgi:hypothetical protein
LVIVLVTELAMRLPACPAGEAPQQGERLITCTNLVSGTSWRITINFDRNTVDANPAHISASRITWHAVADGGNYTLDRKSGELTVVVASSTGGYFLHDRCRLEE